MEAYELLDEIGSGSFGKVFKGRRKGTDQLVALKKISKRNRTTKEIQDLRQECEIQKNLHHPNIIQMLDSFETDDCVVVVTEFAQKDLSAHLCEKKRLTIAEVQTVACHIVSALYFLHSHRILHRDIKPQNILIGMDDQHKLCDFGFAKTMRIGTYVLTSIKGTPLYMAPEVVDGKPYDHNTEMWSLGCILYEMLVGTPPFFTNSLLDLYKKVMNHDIFWPEFIYGDCLTFLRGLLEKNPGNRLTWPTLLHHPFVRDGVYIDHAVTEFALTKALSPSQELAKEKQLQNLQKKLHGYSKQIARTKRKFEDAKRELKRFSEEGRTGVKTPLSSPTTLMGNRVVPAELPLVSPRNVGVQPYDQSKMPPHLHPTVVPDTRNLKVMFQNLNLKDGDKGKFQGNKRQQSDFVVQTDEDPDGSSGASSLESATSSSDLDTDESDEGDDDANTVIMENVKKKDGKRKGSDPNTATDPTNGKVDRLGFLDINRSDKPASRGGSGLLWKSGALFALHSFGSEDKPMNSEEWIYFIQNTMKEVLDNPKSLCEKHFLTMLVAPLRNHLAEPEVVEKIAVLLSLPFTLDKSIYIEEPTLMENLRSLYLDTKVVPNLLYSCKLIVRRRRIERESVTLDEIPAILKAEDLDALEKCLRLATFLVHLDPNFLTQFCDSVCVLQVLAICQLFVKLDSARSGLAADTISILAQILRMLPVNISIVEEILLADENETSTTEDHSELWRLMAHSNPSIQSRSLRAFIHLCIHSERVKTEFLVKNRSRVWKTLQRAAMSSHTEVRETAEIVLQALNYKSSSIATTKSNSTTSNSGHRSQAVSAIPPLCTSAQCTTSSNNNAEQGNVKEASSDDVSVAPPNHGGDNGPGETASPSPLNIISHTEDPDPSR